MCPAITASMPGIAASAAAAFSAPWTCPASTAPPCESATTSSAPAALSRGSSRAAASITSSVSRPGQAAASHSAVGGGTKPITPMASGWRPPSAVRSRRRSTHQGATPARPGPRILAATTG